MRLFATTFYVLTILAEIVALVWFLRTSIGLFIAPIMVLMIVWAALDLMYLWNVD